MGVALERLAMRLRLRDSVLARQRVEPCGPTLGYPHGQDDGWLFGNLLHKNSIAYNIVIDKRNRTVYSLGSNGDAVWKPRPSLPNTPPNHHGRGTP